MEPGRVLELLGGARAGDAAAWDELYRSVAGWVRAVAYGLGLDREDTLDVNQVVCLRLVDHLDRLRAPEALRGWVVTVARHECYRVLRQRRHFAGTEPPDVQDRAAAELDEDLLRDERRRELAGALGRLSADCQRLLRLIAAEPPLSYAEIGQVLGRPVGSIGPSRQRCLGKLRTALVEPAPGQPGRRRPPDRRPGPSRARSSQLPDLPVPRGHTVERGERR